ncbi:hypothetical protein AKJ16_DCAP20346 [Drosera capensis]
MQQFASENGFAINLNKSSIFISGIDDQRKLALVMETGVQIGSFPVRDVQLAKVTKDVCSPNLLTKEMTIQATGVASGLVEKIQGLGFKLQTLILSFDEEYWLSGIIALLHL